MIQCTIFTSYRCGPLNLRIWENRNGVWPVIRERGAVTGSDIHFFTIISSNLHASVSVNVNILVASRCLFKHSFSGTFWRESKSCNQNKHNHYHRDDNPLLVL